MNSFTLTMTPHQVGQAVKEYLEMQFPGFVVDAACVEFLIDNDDENDNGGRIVDGVRVELHRKKDETGEAAK